MLLFEEDRNKKEDTQMNLIGRVAEGDVKALETLYLKYRVNVFRFALTIVEDVFLAEDVMQETFLKIQQHADVFRFGSNEKGWIMTITHHTAIDMLRKIKKEMLEGRIGSADHEKIYRVEITDKEEEKDEFLRILKPLKEVDRQIISLHLVGETQEDKKVLCIGSLWYTYN